MKNVLKQAASQMNKGYQQRKWWQRAVSMMTAVVVFCTTYALILPALTMEGEAICGYDAHEHSEDCYTQQQVSVFSCGLEEQAQVIHSHDVLCYDTAGTLVCQLPEIREHIHNDGCLISESVLVCGLEETEGHVHSEECSSAETVLICTLEETLVPAEETAETVPAEEGAEAAEAAEPAEVSEGHTHGEGCYEVRQTLCEILEAPAHTHSEVCWETRQAQACGLTEIAVHTHDETCSDAEGSLTCTISQAAAHSHTEACLTVETVDELNCEVPVHIHADTCFPVEEENSHSEYLCGSGVHTHTEACSDAEGNLTCTIPEHTHDAACIVADLDLTADVENEWQWRQTFADAQLTGHWPTDVLALADTQLGYQESVRNVTLVEDDLKGYTRYGQWYGNLYGDWCAMFASFCLHYAGVEDFPLNAGCSAWIEALQAEGLYMAAGYYIPKAGDVIFFDFEQTGDGNAAIDADHVGIVAEVIPATQTQAGSIRTIEGNTGDKVAYVTYEMDDPTIIGYGVLPNGKTTILTHQGADYTVTVRFGQEAQIPAAAQLAVEEILPGTDAYNTYYQQSVAAMLDSSTAASAEELSVSFARFFDITFLVDGQAVEPAAPVDVQISYTEGLAQKEDEKGVAVHFAENGIEVLDAQTSQSADTESEQVDTFEFTQDSFSVVGTVLSSYVRAVPSNTATQIYPTSANIDGSGATLYVLYTQIGNSWYAIDGNGYAVPVTVNGSTVTLGEDATNDVFWTMTGSNSVYTIGNLGTGRYLHSYYNGENNYGTTTAGAYTSTLERDGYYVRIKGANQYPYFPNAGSISQVTSNSSQAARFYVAQVGQFYNVWFDGTNGGMMSYYGADDLNIPAIRNSDGTATVTLPETWQSSTKYDYTLQGWYDINTQQYYAVAPNDDVTVTVQITQDTVFYADWVASTYDVGQDNEHVVDSLDTNDFITTYVFDYNVLFNVLSQRHTGTISSTDHTETWTVYNNGETVPYGNGKSLGFVFVDYDNDGEFSYAYGRDDTNINQGDEITPGILAEVTNASGQDLLDLLFNPVTDVIGKNYVGQGNYLYQYMDSTTANYDGEHDGYYYLDARLNAASYHQTLQRFYLYDYLERTSDSRKDGYMNPAGQYSDLLPFNSPYLFESDQLDEYVDSVLRPGYEYDAKDGGTNYPEYNSLDDATTNYFFGIRSDIEFFLPNDSGTQDEYGNYGNISTRGEHMVFDFHGDDDVWVFIDGELVLDIGGLHGIMHGNIDFSTGTVTSGRDGGEEETRTFQEILGHNITEGTHTMQVYYMERGSSQSNCAIYFNIAPRYDLEITKEDIVSAEKLDGAVFAIYNDEALTSPAQLWTSEAAHKADMEDGTIDDATNEFTVVNGIAKSWGISAGKTYYIVEKTPPPGYPASDDIIRITLNNRGTATIETTTLHGPNGVATEGFAVIKQDVNDTLKIVALTVTNQKDGDTTEVRVEKTWAEGSENLPQSITVYLTADGVPIGRRATLNEGNGWAYTWTGLPKYSTEGTDQEIVYEVQEVLVPDYITTQGESVKVEKYEDWIKVDQMSDSKTYLLVHNGRVLTYTGSFGWTDLPLDADGKIDVNGVAALGGGAQWSVTTDHDGFHLQNGLGYTLTFNPDTESFYGINDDAVKLNQVIYYLNSRLVVHDHDVYYQFGDGGTAVSEDGLAFTLYQQEIFTGWMTGITNTPVDEEDQTFVEVTKVWDDGNENHTGASVTIRLYADGEDTGRTLVLNASNNWSGGFYDLPYYQADGETVVEYTVVEDPVQGYLPVYGESVVLPGLSITLWQNAPSIAAGGTYRFTSGSYAMAVNESGDVVAAATDLEDTYQQWLAEANNAGNVVLKNVGSGVYLALYNNSLITTTTRNSATVVTMTAEGFIQIGTRYLEVGAGYVLTTGNTQNLSGQKTTQQVQTTGKDGTGYTVTNLTSVYELPSTGGTGIPALAFGGLLIMAAALMYVITFGRKRQKGGV